MSGRVGVNQARGEVWSVRRGEPGYPAGLLDLADGAPEELFGLGDRDLVAGIDVAETVTIVGSRRASTYGIAVAEELGHLLGAAGLTVVSGMAFGVDAAAHRGALGGNAATVAVLGGGPDIVYPRSQRRLYGQIVEAGAVISERPPGMEPEAWCFPARNRIMAALAGITVVVEAADPSGSLITAKWAQEADREVGAVPGPVTSPLSAGTNRLIFDGALMVRDAQDVLDRLIGIGAPRIRGIGPALEPGLATLLDLVERGHLTCDAVAGASGDAPSEVAIALARLELLGYLRADSFGRYVRTTLTPPTTLTS
jgi:DNA processing protein